MGCIVSPRWGRGWVYGYSPLGEGVGVWLLPAGGGGGCMVTPRWGRGWVYGYSPLGEGVGVWLLPAGGEGGCMVTSRWGRGWVYGYFPLGERVGVWLLPAGGEGYLFVKLIPVFVCCYVRFLWLICLSRGCGFQFYILFFNLFWLFFLSLFGHFVNFLT